MAEREEAVEGRLANVSGVVSCGVRAPAARVASLTGLLLRVCGEVLVVGADAAPPARAVMGAGGSALGRLVAALEATQAERVLWVEATAPPPSPALLLALIAWPESDAVIPARAAGTDAAAPVCAIVRRESVLARARECLATGEGTLEGLLARIGPSAVDTAELAALAAVDFTAGSGPTPS